MKPLLSVCITTYNHEKYISQALNSVLMQKTNFPIEIILGEDDSTDKTREICKKYAKKYSNKIRLFLRDRKNVIYINGRPTGRYNFIENLKSAKGEYIALLDGDDYWIDPNKLQKQVDFLEKNPEYSFYHHNCNILTKSKNTTAHKRLKNRIKFKEDNSELIRGNFIHILSVVFRRNNLTIPTWLFKTPIGDWPLLLLLSKKGKIKYSRRIMGTYRHGVGIWSTLDKKTIQENDKLNYKIIMKHFKTDSSPNH